MRRKDPVTGKDNRVRGLFADDLYRKGSKAEPRKICGMVFDTKALRERWERIHASYPKPSPGHLAQQGDGGLAVPEQDQQRSLED